MDENREAPPLGGMAGMKLALIANPRSGGKKGAAGISTAERSLVEMGHEVDLHLTECHRHALELAGSLPRDGCDGVVAMGGDGTVCQVVEGLLGSRPPEEVPPLGVLPAGRGNSFARDLEILSMEDGLEAIARGEPRPVDVCSFTQGEARHYFVNLMGLGFVTDVARTAHRFGYLGGFSYVVGVFVRTVGLAFHEMELELDGEVIRGENCFVEFCNSRYTGGSMMMAPEAEIDDGLIDVVIAGPIGRLGLLATFPKIFKGTHGQHPAVRIVRVKRATIRTTPAKALLPDGEIFGETPTEVRVHPGLVRFFA